MGVQTGIAWADHTFNIAWGCVKVSEGCANCYAERLARQRGNTVWGPGARRRTFGATYWRQPVAWNRKAERAGVRRRVFCSSMTDWCLPELAGEREKLWPLIRSTPWLDWLLLTKRPEAIRSCLPGDWGPGYPNVWLGVSIESEKYAYRVDVLRDISARLRFVSYEPALGPLAHVLELDGVDWVIQGGEAGPGHRPQDLAWPRAMRDKCRATGTAYFYKQASGPLPERGFELDGEVVKELPTFGEGVGSWGLIG